MLCVAFGVGGRGSPAADACVCGCVGPLEESVSQRA